MGVDVAQKRIEDAIQRELVKWLRNGFAYIEIRYNKNENKRDKIQAVLDKKMGQAVAGTPDLTLFLDCLDETNILELELKRLNGTLQLSQVEWHKNFKPTKNRKAAVAYGLIEAQRIVTEWINEVTSNGEKA